MRQCENKRVKNLCALLLAAAVVAGLTPMGATSWWQESQVAPLLAEVLKGLKPALPEEFGRHLPS